MPKKSLHHLAALLAVAGLPLACSSDDSPGNTPAGSSGSAGQSTAGSSAQSGSSGSGAGGSSAGVAGSSSASGTGGSAGAGTAGNAGNGGAGGGAGAGGSGGGAAMASAGCTTPGPQQELGKWVEQPKLNVNGTDRQWWLWLPTGYEPTKPYPVIFNFHGCGGNDNIVPMPKVAGDKAILVRGAANGNCWEQGPDGVDVTFFDQMLAEVSAKRCADTSRVFATGYSSGSWLVNSLECVRGDKLRATGTVAGGVQFGDDTPCVGKVARIFVHDSNDPENPIEWGNDGERARMVEQNHCMAATTPEDPAPCARHNGCDPGYPVIWCETQGKGHDRQDDLAPAAFWKLFSSL